MTHAIKAEDTIEAEGPVMRVAEVRVLIINLKLARALAHACMRQS